MSEDWKNIVIETGVDTLLNYLAENGEVSSSQISKDLGVSESRIKEWAKALESKDFIEKNYSARRGLILTYTKENKDQIDSKLKEVKEEVEQETERVKDEMVSRGTEIKNQKKKLRDLSEELEDNREKEDEIKEKLEELEDLEKQLEEKLEQQKNKREKAHSKSVKLLSRIDNTLNRVDEAEEESEKFEKEAEEIKKKVKALKKLEQHSQKVEELDKELEALKEKEEEAAGVFDSFKRKVRNIFRSANNERRKTNYEEILSGSVEQSKKRINSLEDPNYRALLKTEKEGQNRKTLEKFLERRLDE